MRHFKPHHFSGYFLRLILLKVESKLQGLVVLVFVTSLLGVLHPQLKLDVVGVVILYQLNPESRVLKELMLEKVLDRKSVRA